MSHIVSLNHPIFQQECDLRDSCGFTLLEILIAVFIFSIVMSIIFGTFNGVISRTDAIKSGMGGYEMARTCLNRITLDLKGIYVEQKPLYHKPDFNDPPDPYRFVGDISFAGNKDFSNIRFTSTEHLPMNGRPENGIAEIVYYVKEEGYPDSEFLLKRSDVAFPYDEDYEFEEKDSDPVLCDGVDEFTVTYLDQDGNEFEKWDSENDSYIYSTPYALKVKLIVKGMNGSYSFETEIALPIFREKLE